MNLTRRSFLLGTVKTGALAILPVPLLLATPETPILEPAKDFIYDRNPFIDIKLVNIGSIDRAIVDCLEDGLYFNNKFIPAQGIELSAYRDTTENVSIGGFRTYCTLAPTYVELRVDNVSLKEDPFELFQNQEQIKVDIISHSARYTGNFLLTEYSINSGGF